MYCYLYFGMLGLGVGGERIVVFVDPQNDDDEFWKPAMVQPIFINSFANIYLRLLLTIY